MIYLGLATILYLLIGILILLSILFIFADENSINGKNLKFLLHKNKFLMLIIVFSWPILIVMAFSK